MKISFHVEIYLKIGQNVSEAKYGISGRFPCRPQLTPFINEPNWNFFVKCYCIANSVNLLFSETFQPWGVYLRIGHVILVMKSIIPYRWNMVSIILLLLIQLRATWVLVTLFYWELMFSWLLTRPQRLSETKAFQETFVSVSMTYFLCS